MVGFGAGKLGNHHEPPLHVAMQPPEQGGPGRRWWGCGRTPGAAAPGLAPLATALLWWAAGWVWVCFLNGTRPSFGVYVGFCFALFCFMLSCVAPFDHIHMYFVNKSCKTLSLQYMWKYVNSKSICVESLFISPVLDINWRSDMVVKDRQQSHQSMSA
jgi:hypothetical protein